MRFFSTTRPLARCRSERSTRSDLEEARAEFAKAIRIDDRFAEPHAALAEVCVRLIEFGAPDRDALEQDARREVARALELAPRLAFTQAALASVQFVLDRDTERAEDLVRNHALGLAEHVARHADHLD